LPKAHTWRILAPMSDQPQAPAPVENDLPLVPLPPGTIPDGFAKNADPASPPPMRMMAARAMAPIPPKALVPIIYQLMMDPDAKIAAAATKTIKGLDEKLVMPILADTVPPQILEAFCHTLVDKFNAAEKVLLNKATPDAGFVYMAEHALDEKIINVVVENQERLLRAHDIVRALKKNPKCLRSELDRAIDFLVREGVFLDDVSEFDDSFVRLGKSEMLASMKKVKLREALASEADKAAAANAGLSVEEYILQGGELSDDDIEEALKEDAQEGGGKKKWNEMTKQEKMKAAFSGGLEFALEGIKSPNRALATAGINNPKITEAVIPQIVRNKQLSDDVIRVICNTGDWTKAYEVKLTLVQNPKTPISLVMRWLPLIRQNDLKQLAKSKQIPQQVALQAKRLLDRSS
jgi:hypothetical protein